MTREEQDRNWALLSEESKSEFRTEYKNRLEDSKREIEDPEGGGDLTVLTSQYIANDLEKIFGKHNLQPSLTYEDVVRELFKDGAWQPHDYTNKYYLEANAESTYFLNYTSEKQAKKLEAINKLLNVAKFLNKNEDGSDWVPDFEDENEIKWYPCLYKDEIKAYYVNSINWSVVYFRTKELVEQAVQILGEDIVRTALTTDY